MLRLKNGIVAQTKALYRAYKDSEKALALSQSLLFKENNFEWNFIPQWKEFLIWGEPALYPNFKKGKERVEAQIELNYRLSGWLKALGSAIDIVETQGQTDRILKLKDLIIESFSNRGMNSPYSEQSLIWEVLNNFNSPADYARVFYHAHDAYIEKSGGYIAGIVELTKAILANKKAGKAAVICLASRKYGRDFHTYREARQALVELKTNKLKSTHDFRSFMGNNPEATVRDFLSYKMLKKSGLKKFFWGSVYLEELRSAALIVERANLKKIILPIWELGVMSDGSKIPDSPAVIALKEGGFECNVRTEQGVLEKYKALKKNKKIFYDEVETLVIKEKNLGTLKMFLGYNRHEALWDYYKTWTFVSGNESFHSACSTFKSAFAEYKSAMQKRKLENVSREEIKNVLADENVEHLVTLSDSFVVGNCKAGTQEWMASAGLKGAKIVPLKKVYDLAIQSNSKLAMNVVKKVVVEVQKAS